MHVAGPPPTDAWVLFFTILNFNQVHMPLVGIQLVRLSHSASYAGPLHVPVPAAKHIA